MLSRAVRTPGAVAWTEGERTAEAGKAAGRKADDGPAKGPATSTVADNDNKVNNPARTKFAVACDANNKALWSFWKAFFCLRELVWKTVGFFSDLVACTFTEVGCSCWAANNDKGWSFLIFFKVIGVVGVIIILDLSSSGIWRFCLPLASASALAAAALRSCLCLAEKSYGRGQGGVAASASRMRKRLFPVEFGCP